MIMEQEGYFYHQNVSCMHKKWLRVLTIVDILVHNTSFEHWACMDVQNKPRAHTLLANLYFIPQYLLIIASSCQYKPNHNKIQDNVSSSQWLCWELPVAYLAAHSQPSTAGWPQARLRTWDTFHKFSVEKLNKHRIEGRRRKREKSGNPGWILIRYSEFFLVMDRF